jgi:hypothetical protein
VLKPVGEQIDDIFLKKLDMCSLQFGVLSRQSLGFASLLEISEGQRPALAAYTSSVRGMVWSTH